MTGQDLVKKCISEIFLRNGFDPKDQLSGRDFELICQEIEERTGTLISVSTVKRLLDGRFTRTPQVATLNALASYLGHKNWQDYKSKTGALPATDLPPNRPSAQLSAMRLTGLLSWKGIMLLTGALLILTLLGFLRLPNRHHFESATFAATRITGNSIPNTVVFSYDVSQVDADSFFIQQSWDKRRRVRIDKYSHTLTDIYYEPGYHIAKLIANDSVIRTFDVSIPTDQWVAYTSSFTGNSLPRYFKAGSLIKANKLAIVQAMLDSSHIPTNEHSLFICSYFPGTLINRSDRFIYKTRVRLTDDRSAPCPYFMFEVFCQRRFMYFMSMDKGCASETNAEFGDRVLSGKTTDLSGLCLDLGQWNDIEWRVRDKHVTIYLNGCKTFETDFALSCGKIAGIAIISNGLYEAEGTLLAGMDGKVISEKGCYDSLPPILP